MKYWQKVCNILSQRKHRNANVFFLRKNGHNVRESFLNSLKAHSPIDSVSFWDSTTIFFYFICFAGSNFRAYMVVSYSLDILQHN